MNFFIKLSIFVVLMNGLICNGQDNETKELIVELETANHFDGTLKTYNQIIAVGSIVVYFTILSQTDDPVIHFLTMASLIGINIANKAIRNIFNKKLLEPKREKFTKLSITRLYYLEKLILQLPREIRAEIDLFKNDLIKKSLNSELLKVPEKQRLATTTLLAFTSWTTRSQNAPDFWLTYSKSEKGSHHIDSIVAVMQSLEVLFVERNHILGEQIQLSLSGLSKSCRSLLEQTITL